MTDYQWDATARRFRAPNGRFLPDSAILQELDGYIASKAERMAALSHQLQGGSLDLAAWQEQMHLEIKALHINASELAHGGRAQMSQADFGRTGRILRDQYAFLRDWANDIASGAAPTDGRLPARSTLYADAARATFEGVRARDQRSAGVRFERNVLHASESCAGCIAENGRGWVEIGSLVPPGSRLPCRVRCRCSVTYSNSARAESEAA